MYCYMMDRIIHVKEVVHIYGKYSLFRGLDITFILE